MATADELIEQAKSATTAEELDAIAAQSENRVTVTQAVDARRQELTNPQAPASTQQSAPAATQQPVIQFVERARPPDPPPGPNATTTPPDGQYFLSPSGDEVNAWGEKKGSDEDKRRRLGGGIA